MSKSVITARKNGNSPTIKLYSFWFFFFQDCKLMRVSAPSSAREEKKDKDNFSFLK